MGEELLAVVLQEVEGDEVGRPPSGEADGAAGADGGPVLQGLERQPKRALTRLEVGGPVGCGSAAPMQRGDDMEPE
ncbi:hypothetical protein [Streptomyces yangpuensis]